MDDSSAGCARCQQLHAAYGGNRVHLGRKLLVLPSYEAGVFAVRCPECEAFYRYSAERDDLDLFEDLEPLPWIAALSLVTPEERAAMEPSRGARVARWQSELESPSPWIRGESASNLAAIACAEQDWSGLCALLTDRSPDVIGAAAAILARSPSLAFAPDAVLAAVRSCKTAPAVYAVRALEFVREGMAELFSEDARARRARAHELYQRAEWLPDALLARTTSLLAHPDELTRAEVARALNQSAPVGPRTSEALWALLEGDALAGALPALGLLARREASRRDEKIALLRPWLRDPPSAASSVALAAAQAQVGADLGPVSLELVAAMRGPDSKGATRALESYLGRFDAPLATRALVDALRGGLGAALGPLRRAADRGALGPYEAELREDFAGSAPGSARRRGYVALLVPCCARRGAGLAEWLSHADPAVVREAAFAARGFDLGPHFERVVVLAVAGEHSAQEWLRLWGLRSRENAARVIAAVPTAPSPLVAREWETLRRRAAGDPAAPFHARARSRGSPDGSA